RRPLIVRRDRELSSPFMPRHGAAMGVIDSWIAEKQSAYLYRVVAGVERAPKRKTMFLHLAEAAEKQAEIWAEQARAAGTPLPGHDMPTSVEEVGRRHRGVGGGNLRAAVFGVNDGLVSNTSLILGVAGATAEPKVILLTGVAGLLAGAFSMAAGEFISVKTQT